MSIEQLLFFALLVGVPLLERLIRVMRERTAGSSRDRTPAPAAGGSVPRRRAPASPPDAERLPASPLPPAVPEAAPEPLRTSERERDVRRESRHPSAASLRASRSERPLALRRSITAGDLRRAMVLSAVLGPCRAIEPEDASQPRS